MTVGGILALLAAAGPYAAEMAAEPARTDTESIEVFDPPFLPMPGEELDQRQKELSEAANRLTRKHPTQLAGAWREPGTDRILLGVTPDADPALVEEIRAALPALELREVPHSWEFLDEILTSVYTLDEPDRGVIHGAWVHESSNRTFVEATEVSDDLLRRLDEAYGSAVAVSVERARAQAP
ncbi:hypothetical protein [Nocardioides sp.]|uniref:hypothetical protein n=1 Tax=Nocardioides sp. TaxID=35761 RepID=UPI002735E669|nr:hypothetical protein [Nocardioides sp.]